MDALLTPEFARFAKRTLIGLALAGFFIGLALGYVTGRLL